ncbi:hypothetical protein BN1723_020815, partial [Verticillium longisporum]
SAAAQLAAQVPPRHHGDQEAVDLLRHHGRRPAAALRLDLVRHLHARQAALDGRVVPRGRGRGLPPRHLDASARRERALRQRGRLQGLEGR